jgi:GNAT superfamily N-acetyltransferase
MAYIDDSEKGIRIHRLAPGSEDGLKAQVERVATLAREIWTEHFPSIIGMEQVEYMLAKFQSAEQIYTDITRNGYRYFAVEDLDSKALVAYCAAVPQEGYVLLSKLYVRKAFRGKGIARSLFDEVAALCGSEGKNRIRLTVNKYNTGPIAVYKKMGFATIDDLKTDIGGGFFMDDYLMEYRLDT